MTIADKLRRLADMWEQDPTWTSHIRWRLLVILEDGDRIEANKHPGRIVDDVLGKEAA